MAAFIRCPDSLSKTVPGSQQVKPNLLDGLLYRLFALPDWNTQYMDLVLLLFLAGFGFIAHYGASTQRTEKNA